MSDELFSQPLMYWVGLDTSTDATPDEIAEFDEFHSTVHVPEVMAANPGFVRATRFELLRPDPRGDFGPRWLTAYEIESEAAAQRYIETADGPGADGPTSTAGPAAWEAASVRWRMMWRRVMSSGSAAQLPSSIFMVGMSVPDGTDADGLAEFNDFYSDIHVDEVLRWGGFDRGSRFVLEREFAHPEPGSPQFCAVYDKVDPERRGDKQPFSSGPPAWEGRDTRWRLTYRRLEG